MDARSIIEGLSCFVYNDIVEKQLNSTKNVLDIELVSLVTKILENEYNPDGYDDAIKWLHQMAWDEGSEEAQHWLISKGYFDED